MAPRSYTVRTEDGVIYRRNRQDLMPVTEKFVEKGREVDTEQLIDITEGEVPVQETKPPLTNPTVSKTVPVRRSSRAYKPVDRLDL